MPDRLTTQLDDGNLERLRILAGGERKVGAYLSEVTAWLWAHKEVLEAAPLFDYTLILPADADVLLEEANANLGKDAAAIQSLQQRIENVEDNLEKALKRIDEVADRRLSELKEASSSRWTKQEVDELEAYSRQLLINGLERLLSNPTHDEIRLFILRQINGLWIQKWFSKLSDEEKAEFKAAVESVNASRQAEQDKATGNHESQEESNEYAKPQVTA